MTEKFTPAPWFADNTLIDSDEHSIALVFTPDFPNEEKADLIATANANLIAAAPEMYQALAAVVDTHRGVETFVIQNARKALAKARGE